eukprot:scaffold22432_cov168-Amphora_coffeaeformis.AAC.18
MSDGGVSHKPSSPHITMSSSSSPKSNNKASSEVAAPGGAMSSRVSQENAVEKASSSVASSSPEEHAVSTMIMALEKIAPQGKFDGTPIRSNRSRDDEDEASQRQPREKITILSRARSKMQSRQGATTGSSSRVPFPKRRQTSSTSSSSKGRQQRAMGSVEIYKASSREHQKHIESEPKLRAPIKSALKSKARSDGAVYTSSSKGSKHRNRHVRIHNEPDAEDDLSVQSDPTNDSSYYDDSLHHTEAGEAFLDHLIDLVGFDEEEYSVDDDMNHSIDASTRHAHEKGRRRRSDRYRWSRCMEHDESDGHHRGGPGKMSSSCHTLDIGAELGKDVLSDISSALSFSKDDTSKCTPMEAPTETLSAVLSKEKEGADYESGCHMDSVFGMEKKQEKKSMDATLSVAEEEVPVQRIDSSAHMTYVSDMSSVVHEVKRSIEHKSHTVFQAIKSPMSFASQISGLASPLLEEPTGRDNNAEEDELEVKYDTKKIKNRNGTPIPTSLPHNDDVSETNKSAGFQLPNSSFFFGMRSMVKSPIPFSSYADEGKVSVDNVEDDEFADETASKVMPKIQGIFGKMSAANATSAKKEEKRTCDPKGSFDEVMDSFQNIISCNRSKISKKEEDTGEQSFLSAISKSFSFWNKETAQEAEAPEEENKRGDALKKAEDFTAVSGEWEKMDRSFPGSSFQDEPKSNLNDDRSEVSLHKDVSITVETIKLTFSRTDDFDEENLQEEKDYRCDVLAEGTHSESVKEETEPQPKSELEGFADFSQVDKNEDQPNNDGRAQTEQNEERESDANDTSFSPPPSPVYKVPSHSPEKMVVSLTPPRRMKVEGVHTPERRSAARRYRRLRNSSHFNTEEPKTTQDETEEFHQRLEKYSERITEESKTTQDGNEEFQIVQSDTWQTTDDLNTSTGSWHEFKSGDMFAGVWPKKSVSAQSEAGQDEEPFQVTYKANSSKWIRKNEGQLEKSLTPSAFESPQSVSMYGESNHEFDAFGRRSLLKAFSGTTQAEI